MISGPISEISELLIAYWKEGMPIDMTPKTIDETDSNLDIFYSWINDKSIQKMIKTYINLKLL